METAQGRRRVLLLGGASEARALAARVAGEPRLDAVLSLAGRTSAPLAQPLPTRIGGFGGAAGLADYLIRERIDRVIDATHPFAARISANAREACGIAGAPLARLHRAPWTPRPGDRWTEVADTDAAVRALGESPRRVFLTIGRLGVGAFLAAPQHFYLVRSIDSPEPQHLPPRCEVILARGPFAAEEEMALMRAQRIDVLVTKNSGGPLTYAKIEAARALGLEVVIVAPPAAGDVACLENIDAALAFLTEGLAP